VILPKLRDRRFITLRRGGTLTDEVHRLLAHWAARCAEHVLPVYEAERPGDDRVRTTIALTHAWADGELRMREAWARAFASEAAKEVAGAPRFAALAACQAVAVAHVAAHELGAAAYAIRAAMEAAPKAQRELVRARECQWQRDQLPEEIRELVLDDQRLRNAICWSVFSA
jgi:hypothetical protein